MSRVRQEYTLRLVTGSMREKLKSELMWNIKSCDYEVTAKKISFISDLLADSVEKVSISLSTITTAELNIDPMRHSKELLSALDPVMGPIFSDVCLDENGKAVIRMDSDAFLSKIGFYHELIPALREGCEAFSVAIDGAAQSAEIIDRIRVMHDVDDDALDFFAETGEMPEKPCVATLVMQGFDPVECSTRMAESIVASGNSDLVRDLILAHYAGLTKATNLVNTSSALTAASKMVIEYNLRSNKLAEETVKANLKMVACTNHTGETITPPSETPRRSHLKLV